MDQRMSRDQLMVRQERDHDALVLGLYAELDLASAGELEMTLLHAEEAGGSMS